MSKKGKGQEKVKKSKRVKKKSKKVKKKSHVHFFSSNLPLVKNQVVFLLVAEVIVEPLDSSGWVTKTVCCRRFDEYYANKSTYFLFWSTTPDYKFRCIGAYSQPTIQGNESCKKQLARLCYTSSSNCASIFLHHFLPLDLR